MASSTLVDMDSKEEEEDKMDPIVVQDEQPKSEGNKTDTVLQFNQSLAIACN